MLFDRIENESRCLICGRPARRKLPKQPAGPKRDEYPRRYAARTKSEEQEARPPRAADGTNGPTHNQQI
jgi:hypothetical protein